MRSATSSFLFSRLVVLALGTAAMTAACDQGPPKDDALRGPPVRLVATNFEGGRTIPANGSIQIAFDRALHPTTVNRQAAVVLETSGRPVTNPIVSFDPITRVLSLSGPDPRGSAWLTPGQPYVLFLTHPDDPESPGGVRAIDGTPLERTAVRSFAFFAGPEETSDRARGFEPRSDFCRDVQPIFQNRCSNAGCHGAPREKRPAAGLILETSIGVANTALARAAQGSNTGPRAGLGSAPARVFAVDMPLIEPGNPSNSYLLYKLLLAEPPDEAESPSASVTDGGSEAAAGKLPLTATRCDGSPGPMPVVIGKPLVSFVPLAPHDRARLSDSILGGPMPYPPQPGADDRSQNLTFEELERIRVWIAQGAQVTDCNCASP